MEWAIGIPLALLLLLCPLMMVGMIVGGWIFGRRAMGNHGGHGMMMCMGHGHAENQGQPSGEATGEALIEELRAERERLDRLIARAENRESR